MNKLIKGKTVWTIFSVVIVLMILMAFFGGFESFKDKVVEKSKKLLQKDKTNMSKIPCLRFDQFSYRKVDKNSYFYLIVSDKEWSGWIDIHTRGMKYKIKSTTGKNHLIKYENFLVDTVMYYDKKPAKDYVFRIKSVSEKDTILIKTW
jgi:hypothetical protein